MTKNTELTLTDVLTHCERMDCRAHFLQISFVRAELLIKWTATVPKHCRLQYIATAPIGLKQCCVQLHWQVCGVGDRGKGKTTNELIIDLQNFCQHFNLQPFFSTLNRELYLNKRVRWKQARQFSLLFKLFIFFLL